MEIKHLQAEYETKKQEIKARLSDFKKPRTHQQIFYELCYCIITAHGSAAAGRKAQKRLMGNDFLHTGNIGNCLEGVRYRGNKEKFVLQNRENILEDKLNFREYLSGDSFTLREKVAKDSRHFKGLGWKASSQFLRNIWFGGLAILDRHILKNLKELGVIDEIPKSLTKRKYLEIEEKLNGFSKEINIPVDELDVLMWTIESGTNINEEK